MFFWDTNLIKLDFVTKIQLAHPLGKGIVDGYKNRNQFIVLFGSNRNLRGWHPAYNLYNERVKLSNGLSVTHQINLLFMEKNGSIS